MDYAQCLDFLYEKLPLFSRIGAAALKKDLTNTLILCEALGNPQDKIKTIHIAGTNGKGSTSHMLASILQESGYKTGLYTSPHLIDFRERIKINGEMIPEAFIIEFVTHHKLLIEKTEPSFFEVTVAMAFDFFNSEKVDFAIIETGLGGRLDSTNIIHPELCVITNIGFDHMALLGDSLAAIANEKAGIIKKQVPVVIGEFHKETYPIFKNISNATESPMELAESNWEEQEVKYENDQLLLKIKERDTEQQLTLEPELKGLYQIKNIKTVLQSVKQLRNKGWNIEESSITNGINHTVSNTGLWGRWQKISDNPKIIADVGHNEDGIQQVLNQLQQTPHKKLHWIIGFVKDKEIGKILEMLPKQAFYYFTQAQIPRALEAKELELMAVQVGLKGVYCNTINAALSQAADSWQEEDLILICGSVFLVGEALAALKTS